MPTVTGGRRRMPHLLSGEKCEMYEKILVRCIHNAYNKYKRSDIISIVAADYLGFEEK